LRLLRRFLPSIRRLDTASLVLMLALKMLGGFLVFLLQGVSISVLGLLFWSLGELLELLFNVYFYAILGVAILSWVSPAPRHPLIALVHSLTEPVLSQIHRILPPMGGMDLSPVVALIALQFLKMLMLKPVQELAIMFN
jgi:YggT family protein